MLFRSRAVGEQIGDVGSEWLLENTSLRQTLSCHSAVSRAEFSLQFVEQAAAVCQSSVEKFYEEVASNQDQVCPAFFAEKQVPDEVPGILWELYRGTREIFVIRDFRDMLCSIRAFNAKRGFLGFDRSHAASEKITY